MGTLEQVEPQTSHEEIIADKAAAIPTGDIGHNRWCEWDLSATPVSVSLFVCLRLISERAIDLVQPCSPV